MATGVSVNSTVTATFSEAMSAASITTSTFTLVAQGGAAVSGTVSYNSANNIATFTPGIALAYSTTYTATITTGAQSSGGTGLSANYTWSFTTAAAPAPNVTAVTPANNATGVAITTTVSATFDQAMNAATFTGSTFTLVPQGGAAVSANVTYSSNGNVATLTPLSTLAYNTTYTAMLTTGVQASTGSALAQNYTWTFTTATAPPPQVTAVTPTNLSTGVAVNTAVTATFNQAMNASTVTTLTFTLTAQGATAVQGNVGYNAATSTATFTPAQNLASNTTYAAAITTGVTSSGGVALAQNYTWSFTTAAPPAPTVAATVPSNGATNVNVSNALTATFSQPMNATTLNSSTFTLATTSGNTPVTGTVTYNAGTSMATFTPSAALAYSTSYTATITTGATSSAGAALATNYVWSFTTGANPNQVTVDFGTTYQTIRGFGGSTAWLGAMPTAVATALFSPTSGLGLNILRVRIDPEGSASGGGAHGLPYETSQWDSEATNGQEAVANNPNALVFASPWTPPAAWKLNGSGSVSDQGATWNESFNSCAEGAGYCGGYLDPNHYADYANYLEDFVKFFNTTDGFNLYAISMQNEPEENVTYESCVWDPDQMDAWVASNASTITSDTYHTKLMMPESDDFNPVDAAKALSDTNAEGLISIIGGHIYQVLFGGSIVPYSIPSGDTPKELWMTEFGPLSTATPNWTTALTTYAESIHNSLVTGQYNAYVWWGLFGYSTGSGATAAGTWGLVDNSGNPTVMGYAVGQYSKFIQPGFVRVSATATPVSGVFVSAYNYPTTGTISYPDHYVIVAINSNTTSENLGFTLENGSGATSLTPYESTSAGGLMQQTAVSVTSGQFNYTLPAQSIVTFVQ
jgi:O-glycosyl hydrolase